MYKYPCVTGLTLNSELGAPNSGKVGSAFPVTPSREYTIIDLMKGKVGVEIALRQGTESTGTMVGTEGARLLDKDGNVLVIPQNGLGHTVPVETTDRARLFVDRRRRLRLHAASGRGREPLEPDTHCLSRTFDPRTCECQREPADRRGKGDRGARG